MRNRKANKKPDKLSRLPPEQLEQVLQSQLDAAYALEEKQRAEVELAKLLKRDGGLLELLKPLKRGQPHAMPLVEYCMMVMARGATPAQVVGVMRDTMRCSYRHLKEGADYQVPSQGILKKYRKCLATLATARVIMAANGADYLYLSQRTVFRAPLQPPTPLPAVRCHSTLHIWSLCNKFCVYLGCSASSECHAWHAFWFLIDS